MTPAALIWLAVTGLVLACLGAVGVKVLQEFSRHQLDLYCRRRRRKELFKEIVGGHDAVSLGAECLQVLGTVAAVGGASLAVVHRTGLPLSTARMAILLAFAAIVLLAATSWIPWAVARVMSAPFLFHTWKLWKIVNLAALPLASGVSLLSRLLARLSGRPKPEDEDESEAFEDEIRTIVSQGIGEGLLEEDAREMIEGVMDLDESDVGDVMTPRSRLDALEADTPLPRVVQFVSEVRRTRIPVYERDLDNVIGLLYVKDLLAELAKPEDSPRVPLRELLRKPPTVLKSMPLDDMLQEFLSHRSHLAIVHGEYGDVVGVVTIEDVLEEIVGEIDDEKDVAEEELEVVDPATTDALGNMHVTDINEALGLGLPEDDDYDTIGGFITRQLGRIPREHDSIVSDGVRITVLQATDKRVERVRLRRVEGAG